MKKLLTLLSAIVIGASASQAATSFSYGPSMKKYVNKEVKYYSEVSANAFRAGILSDQEFNIQGEQGVGLDTDYASGYYGSQHILDVFPDLINSKQGAKPSATAEVSSLYESVFGTNQGGYDYTIANSYNSLKSSAKGDQAFDKNTRLGKMILGQDESDYLEQPDKKNTSGILNAVSGVANIVFKNDFSPSLASTVIGLLASNKVQNALTKDKVAKIFTQLNDIVSTNAEPIRNIVKSLTQTDEAKESLTYQQQLANSTQRLFKGLIFLVSKQTKKFNGGEDANHVEADAATSFWNLIMSKINKTDDQDPSLVNVLDKDKTSELMNSVSYFIDFGISVLHYFRAFDEYSSKIKNPRDGFHIFDYKLNNEEVIENVLKQKYVDDKHEDDFWYNENGVLTTKLNLQNLVSDLEYYLYPNDSRGYSMLRAVAILLGGTKDDFNPILKTAINPLLKDDGILSGILTPLVDKIPAIPGIVDKDTKTNLVTSAIKVVKQILNKGIIEWFTSDGDNPDSLAVSGLIRDLSQLAEPITKLIEENVSGKAKDILVIVNTVISYLNSTKGQKVLEHPWSKIYGGGILRDIGSILRGITDSTETDRRIGFGLQQLNDIQTVLTMKLSPLIETIEKMINGKPIKIKDWLYRAKDLSVWDIVSNFGTQWLVNNDIAHPEESYTTDRLSPLSNNSHYAFNTGAIGELAESLIPADKDDKTKTIIFDKDNNPVSIIMPLFTAIKYFGSSTPAGEDFTYSVQFPGDSTPTKIIDSKTFTDPDTKNTVVVSTNALEDILGVQTINNTSSFRSGSLLGSISRLYGHNYVDAKGKPLPDGSHKEMFNGSSSLFTMFSIFAQFTVDSVKELVADNYEKYFDPKNWQISNEKQTNLGNKHPDKNTVQTLSYDIKYFNPDKKAWFTYHVEMHRQAIANNDSSGSGFTGWVLDQLLRK